MTRADGSDDATDQLVVLEGFHAVKHALRFNAELLDVLALDLDAVRTLCIQLAPDLTASLMARVRIASKREMLEVVNQLPHTGVVGVAHRPPPARLLEATQSAPVVVLDDPRHLGNLGATIRVAAGLRAAGVFVIGPDRLWHPTALRGSAGLHFALPVGETTADEVAASRRTVIALDADGDTLAAGGVPPDAVLLFGSERSGLSEPAQRAATTIASIPIDERVSSYNLATSVAMTLLYWKIGRPLVGAGHPNCRAMSSVFCHSGLS